MYVCGAMGKVSDPPTPGYPYKYTHIPKRNSYKEDLGEDYWKLWDVNGYSGKINSWISWTALKGGAILWVKRAPLCCSLYQIRVHYTNERYGKNKTFLLL